MKFKSWGWLSAGIVLFFIYNYLFSTEIKVTPNIKLSNSLTKSPVTKQVNNVQVPEASVILPIKWNDFGKRMVDDGVIDLDKFNKALGTLSEEDRKLIEDSNNAQIVMTNTNSRVILDLLWAFGLANKNEILDSGEIMQDPTQVGNYASTGGWTLAKGNPMSHFSKYSYVILDEDQQQMVEEMAKAIYRPCCNNSTYFPDCNHGMAMLGLLELMAKNGVTIDEAYKVALQVNSIWFPQTYEDIAVYFVENGTTIDKVSPAEVLGAKYSSASGYRQIRLQIKSLPQSVQGGGGCGT